MSTRIAYRLTDAAQVVGFSTDYLRSAIKTTNVDPSKGVHHLPAKRDSRGRYVVLASALEAWVERMADA